MSHTDNLVFVQEQIKLRLQTFHIAHCITRTPALSAHTHDPALYFPIYG